ncbi:MAG: ArsR family transcriptional regulator [Chloroflexi bacterium]|nr:ArsR family transcriptional regulator [Chloroflexota bacterium]
MEGSRVRILNLLQRKQATVDQLSRDMGLASATVRRHLDILQRDNLVAFNQVKKRTGRPEHTYFLTEAGHEHLPKGYNVLLGKLLQKLSGLSAEEMSNRSGGELLRRLFREMAMEAAGNGKGEGQESFEKRLEWAMTALQEGQFLPSLEEGPEGLRLRLHNCPFRSVALAHHAVCEYDHAMLSAILGGKVVRDRCIQDGDAGCCYLVSPRPASAA